MRGTGILTITLLAILAIVSWRDTHVRAETEMGAFPTALPQVIKAVKLDHVYDFAGEILPLHRRDVVERLDRELTTLAYRHGATILNMKNASKYFPVIEPILREHGLPEDLKYMVMVESEFRHSTSPKGAKGFWQFLKPTARSLGLEVNAYVDERLHIEKATAAACRYLKQLYDEFGSWTLAAAAYNMGPTRLRKEIRRQKESSYYDLNLNSETMRYVFRIVAYKDIVEHPRRYGYLLNDEDLYPPLDTGIRLRVDTTIDDLADFAHQFGISYRDLKRYNPWLLTGTLPNRSRKSYTIVLPSTAQLPEQLKQ